MSEYRDEVSDEVVHQLACQVWSAGENYPHLDWIQGETRSAPEIVREILALGVRLGLEAALRVSGCNACRAGRPVEPDAGPEKWRHPRDDRHEHYWFCQAVELRALDPAAVLRKERS